MVVVRALAHAREGLRSARAQGMDRDAFKGEFDDDDELGDDGTGRGNLNRGKYRCGRCGQYKVNHQCPFIIDRSCRTVGAQARPRAVSPVSPGRYFCFTLTRPVCAAGRRRTRGSPSCRLERPRSQYREMRDEASLGSRFF